MVEVATRIVNVNINTAQVISTEPIKVHGIHAVSNSTSNQMIIFRNSDDDIILRMFTTNINRADSFEIKWLADNGLKIDANSADVYVTVAYSL